MAKRQHERNTVPCNTLRGDYKSPQTMRNFVHLMNISARTGVGIVNNIYKIDMLNCLRF